MGDTLSYETLDKNWQFDPEKCEKSKILRLFFVTHGYHRVRELPREWQDYVRKNDGFCGFVFILDKDCGENDENRCVHFLDDLKEKNREENTGFYLNWREKECKDTGKSVEWGNHVRDKYYFTDKAQI